MRQTRWVYYIVVYFCDKVQLDPAVFKRMYNACGHKLNFPLSEKAQFLTALGIDEFAPFAVPISGHTSLAKDLPATCRLGGA
jgi:hypothetical protein